MSDHIQKTIEDAKADLRKHEEAVVNTKKLINQLCAFAKMPAMFSDADLQVSSSTASTVIKKFSVFMVSPLAACVREF